MVAHDHARAMLLHEVKALNRVRVIPNDISETVNVVDTDPFDGAESRLQGLQVGMNVGENGKSHGQRRTRRGTTETNLQSHRAIYTTHKEIPNRGLRISD